MEFQTVLSSVRPPRIAVLIDKNNQSWSTSVQPVLEFLTQLWGGEHSLLIPTDGTSIDPIFWNLLEAFDSDYVYRYLETGRDDQLSNPEQFKVAVNVQVAKWLAQHQGADESSARKEIERLIFVSQTVF